MPYAVAAQALLAIALLLALGFHRNRAAQVCAVLLAMAAALDSGDGRLVEAALRFGPLPLLAAALLPEPRLLSRRNGLFVLLVVALAGIALQAPAHVYGGFARAAQWLAFEQTAPRGAAILTLLAALLCTLRWAVSGRPMEFGLAVVLLLAAAAFAPGTAANRQALLAASGAACVLAVLYASYRMAFVDGLTGLPNRRALDETLMRLSGTYSLAMIDIDHFKQFNDTYGHDAGDVVLRRVGQTIRKHIGGETFRYGGEEFCVVFQGARSANAADLCERARAAVQDRRLAIPAPSKKRRNDNAKPRGAVQVAVTISLGTAARSAERKSTHEVLKAADQALYKAKAKGRNRVVAG